MIYPLPLDKNGEDTVRVRLTAKFSSAVAILLTCQSVLLAQSPQKIVRTSICKIFSKPSAYDGKLVRIRAVYSGSFEGSYIFDPKCGRDVWFTTPIAAVAVSGFYPKVAEPSFSLIDDEEYEILKAPKIKAANRHTVRLHAPEKIKSRKRSLRERATTINLWLLCSADLQDLAPRSFIDYSSASGWSRRSPSKQSPNEHPACRFLCSACAAGNPSSPVL